MRGASVLMLVQCAGVLLLLLLLLQTASANQQTANDQQPPPHLKQQQNQKQQQRYHQKKFKDNAVWVATRQQTASRRHDIVVQTTCEAKCWKNYNINLCLKSCYTKNWEKPGSCPNLIQINDHSNHNNATTSSPSPFYLPCMNECKKDFDCGGISKCCKHHCGSTCQPAQNLQHISGLLSIPTEIQIKPRKKKALYIKWKQPLESDSCLNHTVNNQAIFYILEQRQQFGAFNKDIDNDQLNLEEWTTCLRTGKTSVLLKKIIKPGKWYQFRVASINANGTRGFSVPVTYIAQTEPGPPKAPEVTVGPLHQQNGTIRVDLQWTKPQSEANIIKYKVFWSKRLFGLSALDSVLVLQHSVSGDTNNYTIHYLEPKSMYFIQIQAIAQFGNEILRGEKSGYVLNTTNYTNATELIDSSRNIAIYKIDNLQLEKLYWSKDENDLKARLTWKPNSRSVKYNITWWGSCKNNKTTQHKLTATTRHSHFDVYDLHFNCRYKVNVKRTHHRRAVKSIEERHGHVLKQRRAFYETSVTFTTPSCKVLQARYKRLKCKHRK